MIFLYYLRLAWVNFKAKPGLTLLMVLAISLGIGLFMTLHTVMHLMSNNAMQHKEDVLFRVQLDSASQEYDGGPLRQMTYIDSMNLVRDAPAELAIRARAVQCRSATGRPQHTTVRNSCSRRVQSFLRHVRRADSVRQRLGPATR